MLDLNNSDQKYRQSILKMVPPRIANRTYNQTNRDLIRVTLGPFECIRESRVWFFKNLLDSTDAMSVYKRSYNTVGERVGLYDTVYTTVHEVHSTRVHIRFQTIAIRPVPLKYESYMVKYGHTRHNSNTSRQDRMLTLLMSSKPSKSRVESHRTVQYRT